MLFNGVTVNVRRENTGNTQTYILTTLLSKTCHCQQWQQNKQQCGLFHSFLNP